MPYFELYRVFPNCSNQKEIFTIRIKEEPECDTEKEATDNELSEYEPENEDTESDSVTEDESDEVSNRIKLPLLNRI